MLFATLKVASNNKLIDSSNQLLFTILKNSYNHYSPLLEHEEIEKMRNTNFNYSVKQTQNSKRQRQQRIGVPPELVKDYIVKLIKDGQIVFEKAVTDNFQRMNAIEVPEGMYDKMSITVTATNGCEDVRVFAVDGY